MKRATESDIPYLNYLFSEVFDKTKDDGTPEDMRYHTGLIVEDPSVWIIIPTEGTAFIGRPLNSSTYEVHVACLPTAGINMIKAGKAAAKYFFEKNQQAYKLIAFVPSNRRDVKLYCSAVGYKYEGIISQSFIKNGKVLDQVVYGLSREDICQ